MLIRVPVNLTEAASTWITNRTGDAAGVSAQARHVAATLEWTAVPGLQAAVLHDQHPGAEVAHTLAGRRAGEDSGSETHSMTVIAMASVQKAFYIGTAAVCNMGCLQEGFRAECYLELAA